MAMRYKNQRPARPTLCPGEPSADELEAAEGRASSQKRYKLRFDARRFSEQRAEFSRRFVTLHGFPRNPANLTLDQLDSIRKHPQYVNPAECPKKSRLFELGYPKSAS